MTTVPQEEVLSPAAPGSRGFAPATKASRRSRRWAESRPRAIAIMLLTLALMTAWSIAMATLALLTAFRARRFYSEVMAKSLGRAILGLFGVRLRVHQSAPFPETQVIYVSNHPSGLDPFTLIALGLPRTRFFMSGWLRIIPPLAVIGYLLGHFWTAHQHERDKRVRLFQRADRVLRRTGESVYLSPEGRRVRSREIGHFNKGAFHLATSLGVPIVPLYLRLPPEVDTGKDGLDLRPGTVEVHVLPQIPTQGWRLEDLDQNRAMVRNLFVRAHDEARGRELPGPRAAEQPDLVGAGA